MIDFVAGHVQDGGRYGGGVSIDGRGQDIKGNGRVFCSVRRYGRQDRRHGVSFANGNTYR